MFEQFRVTFPRRPSLLIALALMAGIGATRLLPQGVSLWVLLVAVVGPVLAALRWRKYATPFLICAVFATGWAYALYRAAPAGDDLASLYPEGAKYAVLEGSVVEGTVFRSEDPFLFEPVVERDGSEARLPSVFRAQANQMSVFVFDVERDLTSGQTASGMLRVYVNEASDFRAGDRLRVRCRLELPRQARNPGEVDMRALYQERGIRLLGFVSDAQSVEKIGEASFSLRRLSESARIWVAEKLDLAPRSEALLRCMMLGDRGALTPELRKDFLYAGSMHMLVVSGLHVVVLSFCVLLLARLLGMGGRSRALLVSVVALGFLVLTGMQLAATRAVVLVLLYAAAEWLERRPDILNLLAASTLVVLLRDPTDMFSYGFILSYGCVLALVLFMPLLRFRERNDVLDEEEDWSLARFSRGTFAASLVIMLVMTPLILAGWNLFTPVALLVNVVAVPMLAIILGSGLLLPLAAIPFMAPVLSWWYGVIVGMLDHVVSYAADAPGGHFFVPAPPTWWIASFYVFLLVFALMRQVPRWRLLPLVVLMALVAWVPWLETREERDDAKLTLLDVGQGACAVIETKQGSVIMVDCGSQRRPQVASWTVAPFLFEHGHSKIDVLVLTHADADHINGVAELLERFEVRELWLSEVFDSEAKGAEALAWFEKHPRVGEVRRVGLGQVIAVDDVELSVLWPQPSFAELGKSDASSTNEGGLVIRADLGYASVLIPGDVEDVAAVGMSQMLEPVDVLLAPHHGSGFALMGDMLQRLQAKKVLVSARDAFSPGGVLDLLSEQAELYTTYQHGALTLGCDDSGALSVTSFIPSVDE